MPDMQKLRLLEQNLVYKVKEVMENNGFSSGYYDVKVGYPNERDLAEGYTWPTITVDIEYLFGRNVELGSDQWPGVQVALDVFANTKSQRDDVSYILWNDLNENYFTFYDFNSAFPSSVGDYSGMRASGEYYVKNLTVVHLAPPSDTVIEGEKHHSVLDGMIDLPNS
jgi:hypothetical protein